MTYFEDFILNFFAGLPEIDLLLPNFFYDFLSDLITFINCFVVFNDFSTLLSISVTYAFVNVAFSFANFISNVKGKL